MKYGRYVVAAWEGSVHMWCSDCSVVEPGSSFWSAEEGESFLLLDIVSHAHLHELTEHFSPAEKLLQRQRERLMQSVSDGHPPAPSILTVTIQDCE